MSQYETRQLVMKQTINVLESHFLYNHYRQVALEPYINSKITPVQSCELLLFNQDWGTTTQQLSSKYQTIFAVLNMANPYVPGGGYLHGCAAQEENMFRRSDCYLSIKHYNGEYDLATTRLLCAQDDLVYFDHNPRICFRDSESSNYSWIKPFPFYELRAAAQNHNFNIDEANKRIRAQFLTLIKHNIKHVVLSAFGCGAFNNPPEIVAELYKNNIKEYGQHLDVIAFSILYPGYGPDNYSVFKRLLV
jgi:uncharacterized protein (TIGR02452 family)